ncbi:MAG: HD-GYP domain-containing protein [Desulfurivibrionaceae bacterium]
MIIVKNLSFLLIAAGAVQLLSAIILGLKLREDLPSLVRRKWLQLLLLMICFFCGHLIFAFLLLHDFPFPRVLIASSIFFGGSFGLLLVALTRATAQDIKSRQTELSEISRALRLKDNRLSSEIRERLKSEQQLRKASGLFLKEIFEIMDEILANRDRYTFEHAINMAEIAKKIGQELNLPEDELQSLELGCLIHDIGKIAIPDDILLKPGNFDLRDKDIMQHHPMIGAKLVARHLQDDRITNIILQHHERLDGSGYPAGLKGKDIGLFPRIVMVADTYEALVSQRPYKKSLSSEEALKIIRKQAAEGKYDQKIVDILARIKDSLKLEVDESSMTADFMKDVELFRKRAYFREPLTDFYNYRYLLFLDDANILRKNEFPYELILIFFPEFCIFQSQQGHILADQVLDELGESLLDLCMEFSNPRNQYDGSVMMFKKSNEFIIYFERDDGDKKITALMDRIDDILQETETDWQLKSIIQKSRFQQGVPVNQALNELFES